MTGFQYQGTMLPNPDQNMGNNNHGSVVEFMGKSYIFYHTRKLEIDEGGDNSYQRSITLDNLTYAADGSIHQVAPSQGDVAQVKCLDGFSQVEAESIAAQSGIEVQGDGEMGVSLTSIDGGDWVGYSQVDFRTGATTFNARVASASGGGTIEVRIDGCDDFTSQAGTLVGTCDVASTGGNETWSDISCSITETSGAHDLCLRFTGSGSSLFALDFFNFE
jgi:arabinoxylan arabinofuranohydrolase